MQQGDVLLYQTVDDGEINITNGLVEMSGGLETSAYLCLFGGNEDDDGRDGNVHNYWGNIGEITERQYRSETQNLLQSLPPSSNNLIKVQDAAKRDLAYFVNIGTASSVDAIASIPALNTLKLVCKILAEGEEYTFTFIENWKAEQ